MERDEVSAKLREWVEHGVMPPAQADAVWQYERSHDANPTAAFYADVSPSGPAASSQSPAAAAEPARPGLRIPVLGEVLGYVGGTLSLTALAALVFQSWDVLGTAGQIGVAALVTVACLGGGWALSGTESAAGRRLSNFLFFFGVAASGFLFYLIADKSLGTVKRDAYPASQLPAIAGSGAACAIGAVIWWSRRTSLQLVAASVALACLISSAIDYSATPNPSTVLGGIFLALGALWILGAELDPITPLAMSEALGSLAMLIGIQAIASDHYDSPIQGFALFGGALVGLALIGFALWRRRGVALGFGAAAIVVFLPQWLSSVFHQSVSITLALLFAGVLLVIMSIFVIRMRPKLREA